MSDTDIMLIVFAAIAYSGVARGMYWQMRADGVTKRLAIFLAVGWPFAALHCLGRSLAP